jgi:hypothetical protein
MELEELDETEPLNHTGMKKRRSGAVRRKSNQSCVIIIQVKYL